MDSGTFSKIRMTNRLDKELVKRGLVPTRSQAESYIRLKKVTVNGKVQNKPGYVVDELDKIDLLEKVQYVSRAGHKLASVSEAFRLNFKGKIVLDVGSSTGGFTDYALRSGAQKVYAVDVGTGQLHPVLRTDARIDLREQTDIRDIKTLKPAPEIVVIDVSFISLRAVLPSVARLVKPGGVIVAMVKPQFEAINSQLKHKGVIKNEAMRRQILQEFESWAKSGFVVVRKLDSAVAGEKGNKERFYVLTPIPKK